MGPNNYNASKQSILKLSQKGYDVFYERIFSIGSNWAVKFDDQIMRQLYSATKKKVGIMCKELMNGEIRILKTGRMRKLFMVFVGYIGPKVLNIIGKDFKVSQSCNHCGSCIRNCPSANIYEKNGKIKFKHSCNSCLRCAYSCPQQAISLRAFSFFILPSGYNIKKILGSTNDDTVKTNISIPAFFENYVKNDSM